MGLYIPPPSGGNGGKGHSNSTGNGGDNGQGASTILPNPTSLIPYNPSIGLKFWGPLVPASDNRPALLCLCAVQFGIGVLGFHKARSLRKMNLARMNVPTTVSRSLSKWACGLGGALLICSTGMELARISLPYDPWREEAKYYRRLAIKNEDHPSWWFGAYSYYRPMSQSEWRQNTERWIANTANMLDTEAEWSESNSKAGSRSVQSPALKGLVDKSRFLEIYKSLRVHNEKRSDDLLQHELKYVSEENKHMRLDLLLAGQGDVKLNANFTKPNIQLGDHDISSESDFEMVWLNFEPWEELKLETEYEVRLIPRWRWMSVDEETNSTVEFKKPELFESVGSEDNAIDQKNDSVI